MAYNYKLHPRAKDDFDEAVAWYFEKNTTAAQNFVDSYRKLIDRITHTPLQFPKARGEVRKARFPKPFIYNIYFFLDGETIYIVAVFHDSRNTDILEERV